MENYFKYFGSNSTRCSNISVYVFDSTRSVYLRCTIFQSKNGLLHSSDGCGDGRLQDSVVLFHNFTASSWTRWGQRSNLLRQTCCWTCGVHTRCGGTWQCLHLECSCGLTKPVKEFKKSLMFAKELPEKKKKNILQ
jgi:hypothetical protein